MSLEIDENLAAVPATAADIDNLLCIARLEHQAFRIRFLENFKRLFHRDDTPEPIALVVLGTPAEDEASIHEFVAPGAL